MSKSMPTPSAMAIGLLSAACLIVTPVAAGDLARGKQLHSNNCISCHTAMYGGDGTAIYTRPDRKIESLDALRAQVSRCKDNLGIGWPEDQVEDVVTYLNSTFYNFE